LIVIASGTLYLGRTRPATQRAADGTFALQLFAYDRLNPAQAEPWVVLWSGEAARAFWADHAAALIPGAAIRVQAARLRAHVVGRTMPEIHAVAGGVEVVGRAATARAEKGTR
jgi:hypothetical protein